MKLIYLSLENSHGFFSKVGQRCRVLITISFVLSSLAPLAAGEITLVRTFKTWEGGVIQSTDPSGIAYHPPSGHLFIVDGEINEIFGYWNCENVFEVTLPGDQLFNAYDVYAPEGSPCPPATNFENREPAGITYNPIDDHFYVVDDKEKGILRYDHSFGAPLAVTHLKGRDPEGITCDPATGFLYVALGTEKEILVFDSNYPDPPFLVYRFELVEKINDAEGIAFSPISHHLFIVSHPEDVISEYTLDGVFVDEYSLDDLSPKPRSPQGLTFAPSSDPNDDPNDFNLYLVDGQQDNGKDGDVISGEPDGLVYEIDLPSENLLSLLNLTRFSATPGDRQVLLEWTVESQDESRGFILERSQESAGPYVEIASYLTHPELQNQKADSPMTEYSFHDLHVQNNTPYFYRLSDADDRGIRKTRSMLRVMAPKNYIPQISLLHVYPNPFNASATITVEIPMNEEGETAEVDLSIHDITGRTVTRLMKGELPMGVHRFAWDAKDRRGNRQASGTYITRLIIDDQIQTQKLILVK